MPTHIQIFKFRVGSWQHRYSRTETLLCRDGIGHSQLHSIAIQYVIDVLRDACIGWEDLAECSRLFLSNMVSNPPKSCESSLLTRFPSLRNTRYSMNQQ
jgi:hypothetical protein